MPRLPRPPRPVAGPALGWADLHRPRPGARPLAPAWLVIAGWLAALFAPAIIVGWLTAFVFPLPLALFLGFVAFLGTIGGAV